MIRFALIVKRIRRRGESSSPSVRQIVLVAVSGGLAIVIIRSASRKMMAKRSGSAERSAPVEPPVEAPAPSEPEVLADAPAAETAAETEAQPEAPESSSDAPTTGADDGLTERVRAEMFENNS